MDFAAGIILGCLVGVISTVLLLFVTILRDEQPDEKSELSLPGLVYGALALLAVGGFSYILKLNKSEAMLLQLMSVLVIGRLGGFRHGLVASLVAAVLLTFLFLPPIGSLWVTSPDDRLALALFLLSTIIGSWPIGGKIASLSSFH